MKRMMNNFLFLAAALLFWGNSLACVPAAAAPGKKDLGQEIRRDMPTNITSSSMQYDANKLTVTFNGNVHVRRPDFDMDADRLTIFFKPAPKKESPAAGSHELGSGMSAGDIDRMVANGSVHIVKDGRTGDAAKVTYHMEQGLLVMEGNPVLREDKNTIRGTTIRFYTQENRSEVVGSSKAPVEVVFSVPENRKDK